MKGLALICVLATAVLAALTAAPAGAQVVQTDKNGCTSPDTYDESLVSPSFLTGSVAPTVTGQWWFEVESVNTDTFDLATVEWSSDGLTWNEVGRLNPLTDPSGSDDQPYSNTGLNSPPAFAGFSFGLPAATTLQVRFRFNTVDSRFQGFRGFGVDAVSLDGGPIVGFNGPTLTPWTANPAAGPLVPFWHVVSGPPIAVKFPEINPQLVTLPDSGALPAPAEGSGYAWFGDDTTGTYCGPDYAARSGGGVTPTAPDTTGSGPSGLIKDKTPTFTFSSNDATATFQCSVDGGAFSACTSPHTVSGLSAGAHTFFVRAVSAAGVVDPTPASFSFQIAQTLADLPAPQLGRRVNVETVSGTVLVGSKSGGRVRYVPLNQAQQIGVGSFLDTRRGTVKLVTATGSGKKTQSGNFSLGIFKVNQSKKKSAKGLTELPLQGGNFRSCSARGASTAAYAARKKSVRKLRGSAKGKYRTRGRNASAEVRGTEWTLTDRCDGTLTQVRKGRVLVRDFVRKRTVLVRAGRSYLAKNRR